MGGLDQYHTAVGAEFDPTFLTFFVNPKQAETRKLNNLTVWFCLACGQHFLSQIFGRGPQGACRNMPLIIGQKATEECRGGA